MVTYYTVFFLPSVHIWLSNHAVSWVFAVHRVSLPGTGADSCDVSTVNAAMETRFQLRRLNGAGAMWVFLWGNKSWFTFPSGHMATPNGVPRVLQHVLTCGNARRHPRWPSKQITDKVHHTVKRVWLYSPGITENCFQLCYVLIPGAFAAQSGSRGVMVAEEHWNWFELQHVCGRQKPIRGQHLALSASFVILMNDFLSLFYSFLFFKSNPGKSTVKRLYLLVNSEDK